MENKQKKYDIIHDEDDEEGTRKKKYVDKMNTNQVLCVRMG